MSNQQQKQQTSLFFQTNANQILSLRTNLHQTAPIQNMDKQNKHQIDPYDQHIRNKSLQPLNSNLDDMRLNQRDHSLSLHNEMSAKQKYAQFLQMQILEKQHQKDQEYLQNRKPGQQTSFNQQIFGYCFIYSSSVHTASKTQHEISIEQDKLARSLILKKHQQLLINQIEDNRLRKQQLLIQRSSKILKDQNKIQQFDEIQQIDQISLVISVEQNQNNKQSVETFERNKTQGRQEIQNSSDTQEREESQQLKNSHLAQLNRSIALGQIGNVKSTADKNLKENNFSQFSQSKIIKYGDSKSIEHKLDYDFKMTQNQSQLIVNIEDLRTQLQLNQQFLSKQSQHLKDFDQQTVKQDELLTLSYQDISLSREINENEQGTKIPVFRDLNQQNVKQNEFLSISSEDTRIPVRSFARDIVDLKFSNQDDQRNFESDQQSDEEIKHFTQFVGLDTSINHNHLGLNMNHRSHPKNKVNRALFMDNTTQLFQIIQSPIKSIEQESETEIFHSDTQISLYDTKTDYKKILNNNKQRLKVYKTPMIFY